MADGGSTPPGNTAEPVSVQTLDPKIIKAIKDGELKTIRDWIADNHGTVDSYTDARSDSYKIGICLISAKGMTALCYAALYSKVDIINELLSAEANPAAANVNGENALHCAVQSDKGDAAISEVVLKLLKKRSDIIDVGTASEWTALLLAISLNLPITVKTLLDYGASANPAIDFKEREDLRDCLNLAAAKGSDEIIQMLLETGKCDVNITATKQKQTPLHVAVRSIKPENVKRLVSHGADTKAKDAFGKCPIHYTLRVADGEVFESLIAALQDSINERDRSGHTILHTAVRQGKIGHVRILRRNNAACTLEDGKRKLPIHYVYEQKNLEDFQELVVLLGKSVNMLDEDGYTLLHIAIGRNSPDFIEVLLDKADPKIKTKAGQSLIHLATTKQLTDDDFSTLIKIFKKKVKDFKIDEEDNDGRTALHWALSKRKFSKVKILLQNNADPAKCAHFDGKNSLHYAFEKHSTGDIIKELIAKSGSTDILEKPDKAKLTPLQYISFETPLSAVKALDDISTKEYISTKKEDKNKSWNKYYEGKRPLNIAIEINRYDIVKVLLIKGAVLDSETLMEAIRREDKKLAQILVRHADHILTPLNEKVPSHRKSRKTTPFRELIHQMPEAAKEALQRGFKLVNENNTHSVEFNYSLLQSQGDSLRNSSFRKWIPCYKENESDSNRLKNPLKLMVKYECTELLQHPVVGSFLHAKWNKIGCWFYFTNFFIYGFYLFFLSLFSLMVNRPLESECNQTGSVDASAGDCGNFSRLVITYILAVLVIMLAFYHLVLEVLEMMLYRLKYLKNKTNYVHLPLYILSVIFVCIFFDKCGCPTKWQWQIGIFVIFLGWIKLIIYASKFPYTGLYVIIFYEIVVTFLKLVAFAILLVVAFAIILFMMFNNPMANETSAFSNIGHSFTKIMTMVTGELDFETLFSLNTAPMDYVPIPYSGSAFVMWIIFLVLIPIVLNNMLVSLAVGDTDEIRKKAELKKLTLQVKTVLRAENVVPNWILNRCKVETVVSLPIKRIGFNWWTVKMFIWGGNDYIMDAEENTYEERRKEEQKEIVALNDDDSNKQGQDMVMERLDQLFELVKNNEALIKKCQRNEQLLMRAVEKMT